MELIEGLWEVRIGNISTPYKGTTKLEVLSTTTALPETAYNSITQTVPSTVVTIQTITASAPTTNNYKYRVIYIYSYHYDHHNDSSRMYSGIRQRRI
jgi:hypothetical protein